MSSLDIVIPLIPFIHPIISILILVFVLVIYSWAVAENKIMETMRNNLRETTNEVSKLTTLVEKLAGPRTTKEKLGIRETD